MPQKTLLIIEDGDEYLRFFSRYLTDYRYLQARDLPTCLQHLKGNPRPDALILDLRFDRVPRENLCGDPEEIADEFFGGDMDSAWRHIVDNQGFLILQHLREEDHQQPALLISEIPSRRLQNLRRLYGALSAVPSFDKRQIARALQDLLE